MYTVSGMFILTGLVFCVLLINYNTLVLVGEANLEEVGDVMAVAGLLKLFLVRRDCQVFSIQLCSFLARQVCELLNIVDLPMILGRTSL